MKRWVRILVLCFLVISGTCFTGCRSEQDLTSKGFKDKNKLSVVTSIYPMYDFVKNIAGDKAEVINLVPAGIEPHDFELSTGDMQMMEQADMFIYNGAGMEHFADKTINALSNKELIVVEAAQNIPKLDGVDGSTDPHTWLSVANAIMEAEQIKDAFVKIDADNAEYYETNYENYKQKLKKLDENYRETIKGFSRDTIVVAHEAFGYLCKEYGLKQEAVEGLTADSEPDSSRMKEIIDFCKEEDIKVIFFEELVSPKVAQSIADETGAETMVLNPIEGLNAEQEEEGLDYILLMEQNLEALKTALK